MLFRDPIPTPAARCGRTAVAVGLAGWACLAVAGTLYVASKAVLPDEYVSRSLRIAGGWSVGPAIIAFIAGTVVAAAGVVRQMHGVVDPGLKLVIAGFVLNDLPMVLVAAVAFYDKYLGGGLTGG